ncbi:ATP-binding protein [Haliangium sp.]|uniref:ATP-binding protein n=1 Tax=Haliangium sp. TaxID=2663208 RepID=UPI003D0BE5EF
MWNFHMGPDRRTDRAHARTGWFGRVAAMFVPAELVERGGRPLQRGRLVARVLLVLLMLPVIPAIIVSARELYVDLAMLLSGIVGTASALLLMRRGAAPERVAVAVSLLYLFIVTGGSMLTDGIAAHPTPFLLLLPLVMWLTAGPRAGWFGAGVVVFDFLFLAWYSRLDEDPYGRMVPLMCTMVIIVLVAQALETVGRVARRELDEANAELMATNTELVAARDAAQEALEVRGAFLARVSHEVRTPLTGILGVSELLATTPLDDGQREYVELIRTSGDAIINITNDILDFSKLEADKVRLEEVEFDLHRLMADCAALMRPRASAKGVRLFVVLKRHVPRTVCGDPGRLRQVVLNLLSNAIKFTENGRIELKVALAQRGLGYDEFRFSVTDSGIGMTDSQVSVVFDAFAQAERSTARRYGGTGLGLAICDHLVRLMGGRIQVESVLGQGSTFRITLALRHPMATADDLDDSLPPSTSAQVSVGPLDQLEPLMLLLVEDDLVSRKVVQALLLKLGCRVDAVASGKEAVDALETKHYDLVLMDCEMPGMNGFEATAAIRALSGPASRVPIIAMTGHTLAGDRERCLAAGMTDYVGKPIKRRALLNAIKPYLREPSTEQTWDSLVT